MNTKKIGKFLKEISATEYRYLKLSMSIRDGIECLIRQGITRAQIVERFKISPRKYNDFISANYDYDLKHMAILNAWYMEIEMENLKESVPIQVSKS